MYTKYLFHQNVEKALAQFNLIISKFEFSHFPAVYYGIGKSLAFLHRHSEALVSVEKGLGVLPSYRLITLTWPGTNVNIIECLPHEIEVRREGGGGGEGGEGRVGERGQCDISYCMKRNLMCGVYRKCTSIA